MTPAAPFTLADPSAVASPALLVSPAQIRRNLAATVEMAGGVGRLRPHVKTHKMPDVVRLLVAAGVTKHKAATIAEAEILAANGAADVLVAYPLIGPNPARLAELAERFPAVAFAALVDSPETLAQLASAAESRGVTLGVWLDLDVGMGRTGAGADTLFALCAQLLGHPRLTLRGVHAYDGHNQALPEAEREAVASATLAAAGGLRSRLEARGFGGLVVTAGGTPSFPAYARLRGVPNFECSPGTFVLHDHGYGRRYPDYAGLGPAALLLTRVVSRPGANRVTLDLGHKAVAADVPLADRFVLYGAPDYRPVMHSEEHLVIESDAPNSFPVGREFYALPGHVCPTVALHETALEVDEAGAVVGEWPVLARRRRISV